MASLSVSLLAYSFTSPAHAGTCTDTPTHGTTPSTVTPAADATNTASASPADATASASASPRSGPATSYTIQVSPGTFTDTFTWTHDNAQQDNTTDPPPSCILVAQSSSATWYVSNEGGTGTGSGQADCGLSGGTVTSGTYNAPNPSLALSATLYSVKTGLPFSVSCSPTASFTGTTGSEGLVSGEAMVGGGASVYPITLTVGGTTPDSSGNPNILVGQQCTATVNGIPSNLLPYATYDWSGISGTKFESWTVSSDSSHTTEVDAIPATNSTQWYWNDLTAASETVKCTVTVTPPAGQGSPFTLNVTAPKQVSVQVPGWFCYEVGGYMQVNTTGAGANGSVTLHAGPNTGQIGGMTWTANVMSSALFTSGTIELVQVVTPNVSYVSFLDASNHPDPENGKFGLDTRYPYTWDTTGSYAPPYNPTSYIADDNPYLVLSNTMSSAMMKHQFTDYLMFQPPGSSEWVPLGTATWSTNGNAVIPSTDNWANYATQNGSDSAGTVSPTSQTNFTAVNTFPSWTRIDVFPSF